VGLLTQGLERVDLSSTASTPLSDDADHEEIFDDGINNPDDDQQASSG
jgi:hypothetical protein